MDEEYIINGPSARASSETVTGSTSRHHLLEKVSFTTETSTNPRQQRVWRRHVMAFCVHFIIFLIYSTIAVFALDSPCKVLYQNSNLLYSPANEVLRWKLQEFNSGDGTEGPYQGYPRPELEDAWNKLLGNMNIRLSLEDLKAFNRDEDAVQLPDGSGYIGSLNVYHEIHCVKWMHTYVYQEYYYPNLDDAQREENRLHSEHCINQLRKSAMCHGDVGMIPYSWGNNTRKPLAKSTAHQCIDWDSLADWTNERAIDMFKPGLLVHPTMGPVYSEGDVRDLME